MSTPAITATPAAIESTTARSSWSTRRQLTLAAALVLIIGGAVFASTTPGGFIEAHLIERRIMLGAATMVGGFLLLAVHVLTGILAVQPARQNTGS